MAGWRRSRRLILILFFCNMAFSENTKYQSQTANLTGARIHYLKAGTGPKTLVLIHGFVIDAGFDNRR